jgi:REP element-mobilizing transposase RayT
MNTEHWRTPAERRLRLRGFDYRTPTTYFVTIMSFHRACIFGDVIDGVVRLSALGEIVRDRWAALPEHVPGLLLHATVVMPNHFHGLVTLPPRPDELPPLRGLIPGALSTIIAGFKSSASRRAGRQLFQSRFCSG